MTAWVRRRHWMVLVLAVVLAVGSVGVARPAEAADGSLVVAALKVLERDYVDPVDAVASLNVAIGILRQGTHLDAAALPDIPAGTTPAKADAIFVAEFGQAARTGSMPATPLAYAATQAMLTSLHDSHTYFLPPQQFQEGRRQLVGDPGITGIGVRISSRKDDGGAAWIFVEDVLPGSPAERAGLKRFDRILQAGSTSLRNVDAEKASSAIRGAIGSTVDLVLQRGDQVLKISVVRAPIPSIPAYATFISPGIAYARLFLFSAGSGGVLGGALEALDAQGPVRSVILDLRSNPGGLVSEAARVGGLFLPPRTDLARIAEHGSGPSVLRTLGAPPFPETPLVVLVDQGSASASELLAAALKEHGRATIVGERTAGALGAAIEVALPEGGMSVTVARITTPSGAEVENVGVSPDSVATLTVADMERGEDPQLQAALRTAAAEALQHAP
ncbi:MAG TPA: S41 family peptidase [Gemmatimonadales bacterium]|nr:S41 family peptidase [Gemmatimonadales bacterium]